MGGLGEAALPPGRERKRKLSRPPNGRAGRTDDDEREEGSSLPDQREPAREQRGGRGSSRCRLACEASIRELTMTTRQRTLSRRYPTVERSRLQPAERLGEGSGERRSLSPVEEQGFSPVTVASRWNLFHRPPSKVQLVAPSYGARSCQRRSTDGRCRACAVPRQL